MQSVTSAANSGDISCIKTAAEVEALEGTKEAALETESVAELRLEFALIVVRK
jgi:hypothetical protein